MPRFIAFLRAINVGGHVVKMDELRQHFEALSLSAVETFIASGNVIFEAKSKNSKSLEKKIEDKLREALGYEVATFLRTDAELADLASYAPFSQAAIDASRTFCIGFLAEPLDGPRTKRLMDLKTELDDLHVHGREIYWLSRLSQAESTFSNKAFEKTVGVPTTLRGVNTIRRMAAKYSSSRG